MTASASTSAVAGRWRSPLAWSSRRRPSAMAGTRTMTKGAAAASAMTAKASTAAARPSGGSHSHTPSQESAVRVRVRPPRYRAGSVLDLVPAAHRRRFAGAGMDLYRPGISRTRSTRRPARQRGSPIGRVAARSTRAGTTNDRERRRFDCARSPDVLAHARGGSSDGGP